MKEDALRYTQLSLYCIMCSFFYFQIYRHCLEPAVSILGDIEFALYKRIGSIAIQLSFVVAALVPATINVFVSSLLLKYRNTLISLICSSPIVFVNLYVQTPAGHLFQSIVSGLLISSLFAVGGMFGANLLGKVRSPITYLNKPPFPKASSPFYFSFTLNVTIALFLFPILRYILYKGVNLETLSLIIFSLLYLGAFLLINMEKISGWIIYNVLNATAIVAVPIYYQASIISTLSSPRMLPSLIFILIINTVCYFNRERLMNNRVNP